MTDILERLNKSEPSKQLLSEASSEILSLRASLTESAHSVEQLWTRIRSLEAELNSAKPKPPTA